MSYPSLLNWLAMIAAGFLVAVLLVALYRVSQALSADEPGPRFERTDE